jgi:hypothetical protein
MHSKAAPKPTELGAMFLTNFFENLNGWWHTYIGKMKQWEETNHVTTPEARTRHRSRPRTRHGSDSNIGAIVGSSQPTTSIPQETICDRDIQRITLNRCRSAMLDRISRGRVMNWMGNKYSK